MDRNELSEQIRQLEVEYDRAKLKRFAYTVLFYTIIFIVLCHWRGDFESITFLSLDWFLEIGGAFLAGAILSAIFVSFNSIIFHQLYERSASEKKHIEDLKKQLNEMDNNK